MISQINHCNTGANTHNIRFKPYAIKFDFLHLKMTIFRF